MAVALAAILMVSGVSAIAPTARASVPTVDGEVKIVGTYTDSLVNDTNLTISVPSIPAGDTIYVFVSAQTATETQKIVPLKATDNVGDVLPILFPAVRPFFDGGAHAHLQSTLEVASYILDIVTIPVSSIYLHFNATTKAIATAVVLKDVSRAIVPSEPLFPNTMGVDPASESLEPVFNPPDGTLCSYTAVMPDPTSENPENVLIVTGGSMNGTLVTSNNSTLISSVSFPHAFPNVAVLNKTVGQSGSGQQPINITMTFSRTYTTCNGWALIVGMLYADPSGFGGSGAAIAVPSTAIDWLIAAVVVIGVGLLLWVAYKDGWIDGRSR